MQAGADLQPLQLQFGNEDVDEDMVEPELPGADADMVDADGLELPEPEESRCSRVVYQRFLSQYRRWVQRQLAACEDDAQHERLSKKLTMMHKTPEQK